MLKQELHCSVAGALQYEINLRDKQIKELISKIEVLEKAILNKIIRGCFYANKF